MNKKTTIIFFTIICAIFITVISQNYGVKLLFDIIINSKYEDGINIEIDNNSNYQIKNVIVYVSENGISSPIFFSGNITERNKLKKNISFTPKNEAFSINYKIESTNGSKTYPALFIEKGFEKCVIHLKISDITKEGVIKGTYRYYEGTYSVNGKFENVNSIE